MGEDIAFRWVSVLGFPIFSAVATGYALYRIGIYLASAHVAHLETNTAEMKHQTEVLEKLERKLPSVCKAECPIQPPTVRTA